MSILNYIGNNWKICNSPSEFTEGLFGQIILWPFELLPFLKKHSIYPDWDIKSKLYGEEPNFTVIPGVFDLAYTPHVSKVSQNINFMRIRNAYTQALGDDWSSLHELFFEYFKIPEKTKKFVDLIEIPYNTLGVHYRGTDKNKTEWDTNPVTQEEMLILVKNFLGEHSEISALFLASDEYSFIEKAKQQFFELPIINLGEVDFFKNSQERSKKSERALVDCILLSKCSYLLKCSSALSGFAKIINPDLKAYRISASKLFSDVPYFPEAYIPRLSSNNPDSQEILKKLFANDWSYNIELKKNFGNGFHSKVRFTCRQRFINRLVFFIHLFALIVLNLSRKIISSYNK
jgi:hypothetical protein